MVFGEEGFCKLVGCCDNQPLPVCCWHPEVVGHPSEGVGDAGASGLFVPYVVATVVAHCGADVKAFACVWGPGVSVGGANVGEDFGARWGERRPVVVEMSV